MIYHTTTYTDVVESFLLGLSCLVGGDQFYIFISQTEASPKTQSYIAITTVLATLFLAIIFYDEYNASLFDVCHVVYLIMLMIWISILYQKVKDPFITTIYTSILAMVLTFLVILCCIHYSHRKDLLPSFLSGLLFARLLPTLIWTFLKEKKPEYEDNLSTLSMRLALFRVLFCVASIMIKITSGNLGFAEINVSDRNYGGLYFIRLATFMKLWEHFNKLFVYSYTFYIFFSLIYATSLFLFFSSIVLHLGLPPILHKFSHLYSHHLYCTIDIMSTVSHLFGLGIGTKYQPSITTNSYYWKGINIGFGFFLLFLYLTNNYSKVRSPILLYTIVILSGFILGYVWSYSLVIINNIFLLPTCVYEENQVRACCGDKTEAQCYCRLDSLIRELNKKYQEYPFNLIHSYSSVSNYPIRFSCSKNYETLGSYYIFNYCHYASNALLLLYNIDGDISTQIPCCTGVCSSTCGQGKCKCLNLFGIYKIQTVTTSTCENCQLTIRLEGTCCGPGECTRCFATGTQCVCDESQNNCCLCLKCCDTSCSTAECKCCIHVCKGDCKCNCFSSSQKGVRIFICFKNDQKKCIREIKPNFVKDFFPDLTIQNQFDIKGIFISDCCHVDLRIDLHCYMKNNFFRFTPISYPKKPIEPLSLTLMRDGNECCQPSGEKCCCKNNDFVKVCVKYDNTEKNCEIKCKCQGLDKTCCCRGSDPNCCCGSTDGKCCCCIICDLNVDKLSSFYQKIDPIRVKLILILWFFVLIFLMIAISETSKSKSNKLKYYEFFPIRSFETIKKEVEKNNMNSMHTVLQRLRAAQEGIFLETFGEKDKKNDLDHMLQLCKCAFDPYSFNRLKHYVLSQSSMLIASPQYVNRRLDLELVKWSYCVGFVYTYIILMFLRIQNYFLIWEKVWQREYLNYRKKITSKFNKITQSSKFSISLMCEVDVNQKTILYLNKTRKGDWGCAFDEIDRYTNLYDKEEELSKSPPYRMDLRLMYFLDRWDHRIESIMFWIHNQTNLYDWKGLLNEYPKIRKWFYNFRSHIHKTSIEVSPPVEVLNLGTEILESKVKG